MNKPTNTKRPFDGSKDSNNLYAVPAPNRQKEININNEFSNPEIDREDLTAPQNLYDKVLKFCCSWSFIFIFFALLSVFVIFSIIRYWFL